MSHLDPSSLARYNSLADPNLQSYFSNERIRSHLKHAGLISRRGEIIPDSEYRTRLARREHKKHVRHMLAENIVSRAIDMERARQAEVKRHFEIMAKAALVNNIKESRGRSGSFSGLMTHSTDLALLSIDTTCPQTRPKSANIQNELSDEKLGIPRIRSAHTEGYRLGKYSSKTRNRRRSLRQSKSRSLSGQNRRSPNKCSDSSIRPCQITMIYYGPTIKLDYDHLVFESTDEIIVMQQHCGGENIPVYKEHLQPGAEFTFDSHRHADFPFGLSLYVKGYIDSRISTCCEYKHRHGVRLGGDRGHFAIKSVKGSKPCIKCQFEKQARLKKYAESPKDKDNENKKPITIPLPVSDEPKTQQTPTKIPIRLTSISNFHDSDKKKDSVRDGYSIDSSIDERKLKSKDSTSKILKQIAPINRKELPRKFSFTSDDSPKEKTKKKKNWKIIFHASNSPTKNILVKFSLISNDETETYEINIKKSTSDKQYAFTVKLKDIGKPEQIRLKIYDTEDDDDDENIKWYLDHIELIDTKTESHLIFPCKQWIRLSQEKILKIFQETPRKERIRKDSSSTNDSRPSSSNYKTRKISPKISDRSSSSSIDVKQEPTKFYSIRRISPDNQSQESTPRNEINNQVNKIPYRVTIYPADDHDGEFSPVGNSRIFLRLNNQTKEINLTGKTDQSCPAFESGEKQTFEIEITQNINERPKKLTIGYVNSDITAMKWKLQKIVLVNLKTDHETTFLCKEVLRRNESNFRAEKSFEIDSDQSDNELTPRNEKLDSPKSDHEKQIQTLNKQRTIEHKKFSDDEEEQIQTPTRQRTIEHKKFSDDEEQIQTPSKQQANAQQKINDDEEQIQTPTRQRTNVNQKINDDEEQIQTPTRQQTNVNQKINDDEEQIQTPTRQRTNVNQKVNDDEEQVETSKKQQTDDYEKQKSPSFQSMTDAEADYKKIFRKLDRDGKLKIGSRTPTPTSPPTFKQLDPDGELKTGSRTPSSPPRPKTRRGPHDQNNQQHQTQPVESLILDGVGDQTARSNDQQNQNTLPSTTTDNAQNPFQRWYTTNEDDDEDN